MIKAFIFIGPSGSGKGTQAKKLIEKLNEKGENACYVESGATFREFIEGDKYLEKRSKELYSMAKRQPDFLAVYMWSRVLIERFSGEDHIIFDGTPRSLNEAKMLDTALRFLRVDKTYVISLALSPLIATKRLMARGRLDDDPYGIEKRLAWFTEDVVPAIEYYKKHTEHTFLEVDGAQDESLVWEDVQKVIL
jgi:adenylate kinase